MKTTCQLVIQMQSCVRRSTGYSPTLPSAAALVRYGETILEPIRTYFVKATGSNYYSYTAAYNMPPTSPGYGY